MSAGGRLRRSRPDSRGEPDWTPNQVKGAMLATLRDVPGAGGDGRRVRSTSRQRPGERRADRQNTLLDPGTGLIDWNRASFRRASFRDASGSPLEASWSRASFRCDCGLTASGEVDSNRVSFRRVSFRAHLATSIGRHRIDLRSTAGSGSKDLDPQRRRGGAHGGGVPHPGGAAWRGAVHAGCAVVGRGGWICGRRALGRAPALPAQHALAVARRAAAGRGSAVPAGARAGARRPVGLDRRHWRSTARSRSSRPSSTSRSSRSGTCVALFVIDGPDDRARPAGPGGLDRPSSPPCQRPPSSPTSAWGRP